MSQKKKKVIVTTKSSDLKPTASRVTRKSNDTAGDEMLTFGRKNYILMLIGIGLIFLGMLLMLGGHQASPEVWEDDVIYSTRITVLAPIVILAGIGVEIYAIFSKK